MCERYWTLPANARTHADLECTQVESPLSGRARLRASKRTHGAGCANDRYRAGESEDRHGEHRLQHAPLRLAIRKIRCSVSGRGREARPTSYFSRNDTHQTAIKRIISHCHAEYAYKKRFLEVSRLRRMEKAHTGPRHDTIHLHARLGACGLERVAVGISPK